MLLDCTLAMTEHTRADRVRGLQLHGLVEYARERCAASRTIADPLRLALYGACLVVGKAAA